MDAQIEHFYECFCAFLKVNIKFKILILTAYRYYFFKHYKITQDNENFYSECDKY